MSFHEQLMAKLLSCDDALRKINGQRLKGKKIVFTNGCFDILHQGHLECLSKARDLGDFLIVGLNTDESVKRLNKAPNRPVNNENARARVLSGLNFVDAVVLFNEDTPLELIKQIEPDLLIKGGDYKEETVVGYNEVKARGGRVVIIPLVDGFSTTSIIAKMK